nr:hypothetical protein [uncultured Brevundimonas sp.]
MTIAALIPVAEPITPALDGLLFPSLPQQARRNRTQHRLRKGRTCASSRPRQFELFRCNVIREVNSGKNEFILVLYNYEYDYRKQSRVFVSNVVDFSKIVPAEKIALLNRGVMTWAARVGRLRKLSYALDDLNKRQLGDLVQMSEQEIMDATGASPKIINILKSELAAVGLQLDMLAPHWKRTPIRPARDIW